MMRPIYDYDNDTVANCFSLIERGMRRLGIDPRAPMTQLAARTCNTADKYSMRETAVARRGAYELSEHQVARMVVLHHEGKIQAEIAAEIGCTQSTVAKRLLKLGIRQKTRRHPIAA